MKSLNVNSISDVITNSSSEVFCVIEGPLDDLLDLDEVFNQIFDNQEGEWTLCSFISKDNKLKIEMPYRYYDNTVEFIKSGLNKLLELYPNCYRK